MTLPYYSHQSQALIHSVIERIQHDKGAAARLRRADNVSTEYQSWEYLASSGIQLDRDHERIPCATVAAAVAKSKPETNGDTDLGEAIASCYEKGANDDQAKARLRRVLACDSVKEVCRVLRPLLHLIITRGSKRLDFVKLLSDLLQFHWEGRRQRIKARWAQKFYHQMSPIDSTEG